MVEYLVGFKEMAVRFRQVPCEYSSMVELRTANPSISVQFRLLARSRSRMVSTSLLHSEEEGSIPSESIAPVVEWSARHFDSVKKTVQFRPGVRPLSSMVEQLSH